MKIIKAIDFIWSERKEDPKFFWYIIAWIVFCISAFPLGGWRLYHNWWLTTPERIADPFNWILGISYGGIYLTLVLIGRKLKNA